MSDTSTARNLKKREITPLTDAESQAITEIVTEAEVKTKEWKKAKKGA